MNVTLVLVNEDGKSQEVALKRPLNVIGRQTDVAIRIPSQNVSRHHCEVSIADHKVVIKDLGSSNGTFVNKKRVTQADLKPGDKISVGGKVFVVRVNGIPEDIDAEDAFDDGFVPVATGGVPSGSQAPAAPVAKPAAKAAAPAAPTAKPAAPAPKPAPKDLDDSDEFDFDFLDEDEDLKKQPKL